MSWTTTKRMLGGGWHNFVRGGAVSIATVLIMTVTLGIIGSLIFLSALLSYTLDTIKDKVNVSVYFVTTATEGQILGVKDQLEKLPQVESVSYTSAADALAAFYPQLGNALKQRFAGWRCHFFTSDLRMAKMIRLSPSRRVPLFNGALECRLFEFVVVAGSNRKPSV